MADLTYLLPVWDTISDAWSKVKGTKGSIWAAIIVIALIAIGAQLLAYVISTAIPNLEGLFNFIIQIIEFLLQMGVLYIGIQRARDLPFNWRMMFRAFEWDLGFKVILLYVLQVIIFIPFIVLIIIGIVVQSMNSNSLASILATAVVLFFLGGIGIFYLMIRMYLSMAFVIDQRVRPWQAIKLSFQATRSNFWRIVAILIIYMIILIIAAIPFFIGWIWVLPMGYILYGLVYKNLLFNVSASTTPTTTVTPKP